MFKSSSHVVVIGKIDIFLAILSIFINCKNIKFINFKVS
jgi:hypothetical protein